MSFVPAASPKCIDLFAGSGGMSEGLLAAGLDVVSSVELHPQAALTHAFNHPRTGVFVGDIRAWDLKLLDAVLRAKDVDRVGLVVGGPPCQGFSSAGKKNQDDPRNSLFRHFLRVVQHVRPRMFLLENVPGFRRMYDGGIYREAVQGFEGLGYRIVDDIVIASSFGVPQTRRRFVMVGWLPDEADDFSFPNPESSDDRFFPAENELFPLGGRQVSAGEAIGDLAFLEPGFEATAYGKVDGPISSFGTERRSPTGLIFNHLATKHRARAIQIMEGIPEGGTIKQADPSVRSAKRTMARISRGRLSNTVLSLPDDMIHYMHNRILTVREAARLQTFDDDFVFFGKRTSGSVERRVDVPQYTQVGNAVPPLLAKALGCALLASLGGSSQDLRDLEVRRKRQDLVLGSSGFAGYSLAPEAKREIGLMSVTGEKLELPVSDSDAPVKAQSSLRQWNREPNPRRGQWAPGVEPKLNPSWHTESVNKEGADATTSSTTSAGPGIASSVCMVHDRHRQNFPDSSTPQAWYTAQGGEAYAGESWDEPR